MPDPTPAQPSGQSPDAKKGKKERGLVNKAHKETVSKTEKVVSIAQKPAHAPKLAEREIDEAFVTALSGKCKTARGLLGEAVDKTTDKEGATGTEGGAKSALLELVREMQSAARQKWADEKPGELKDYYIGSNIDQSRAVLEQAVAGILEKLKTDKLPGITAAKVTALGAALKTYQDCDVVQAGAGSDATGTRLSLDDLIVAIDKDRRKILFAVEAAWPSSKKANAAIRTEFGLTPDRPYVG